MTFKLDGVDYIVSPSPALDSLSGMQLELWKFLGAIAQCLPERSKNLKSEVLMALLGLKYPGSFWFRFTKLCEKGAIAFG